MVFEKDKKNITMYHTTFGESMMGFFTTSIEVTEEDSLLEMNLEYALDINSTHYSDCVLKLQVKPR